ncbi:MAG: phage holin family protein [Candidatus Shapirobacteria bacterium]|nr:phage holin family protein [Candidatus Shapirobacteria bacterium]
MKKFLRFTLIVIFALITLNQIWGNLYFQSPIYTLIKVAIVISIFELIIKPILKILLLPINFLTLGTFRIIIDTLGLYLATFFLADFKVKNIFTSQFNFEGFWAYLVSSLTLGLILIIYNSILSKKS